MDRIRIVGGERLQGTIPISGAKNAALPLMIASLLTRETLVLKNVPRLADVTLLGRILGNHGVDITAVGKKVGQSTIDGQTFKLKAAEYRGEAPQVRGAYPAALYLASTQAHRLESKKGTMCHEDRSIQRIALGRR